MPWLPPSLGNYQQNLYHHLCVGFCVDIRLELLWVNKYWDHVCRVTFPPENAAAKNMVGSREQLHQALVM